MLPDISHFDTFCHLSLWSFSVKFSVKQPVFSNLQNGFFQAFDLFLYIIKINMCICI